MALTCSTVRITLAGQVLIDFGHFMEFEPRLEHSRQVQVTGGFRAPHSRVRGRRQYLNEYEFSRVEVHGSNEKATHQALALVESWPDDGNLVIQVRGPMTGDPPSPEVSYEHQIADAALTSAPCIVRGDRTHHTVRIVGGALTQLIP